MILFNRKQLKRAFGECLEDPRLKDRYNSFGTIYKVITQDSYAGLGYRLPNERTVRGKEKFNAYKPHWFLAVWVRGKYSTVSNHIDIGIERPDPEFEDILEAIESFMEVGR